MLELLNRAQAKLKYPIVLKVPANDPPYLHEETPEGAHRHDRELILWSEIGHGSGRQADAYRNRFPELLELWRITQMMTTLGLIGELRATVPPKEVRREAALRQ